MEITLLYFDNCPNWRVADELLDRLAHEHQDVIVTVGLSTPRKKPNGSGSSDRQLRLRPAP